MIDAAHPWMALALAFAAVPVLLHLLRWPRRRPVLWAAMGLVVQQLALSQRSLRTDSVVLLTLRCATILAIVAMLCQPLWRSAVPERQGAVAAILLIDDSLSTGYEHRGTTRFRESMALADAYVATLRPGDAVHLLTTSGIGSSDEAIYDVMAARRALAALQPGLRRDRMAISIRNALLLAQRVQHPQIELVLVSDGLAAGWHGDDEAWGEVRALLRERPLRIMRVSPPPLREHDNLGVMSMASDRSCVAANETAQLRITVDGQLPREAVAARSQRSAPQRTLRVLIDDRIVAERVVPQHAEAFPWLVSVPMRLPAGAHVAEARLLGERDALPADDARWLLVDARSHIAVAVVSDSPALSRCIVDALQPGVGTLFRCSQHRVSELHIDAVRAQLADSAVIIVVDPPALGATVMTDIERFAEAGGGVLVMCGPRSSSEAFHADWWRGGDGIAGCGLVEIDERPVKSGTGDAQHPAWAAFAASAATTVADSAIAQHWRITPARIGSTALWHTARGAPLLMLSEHGAGRSAVLTTIPESRWSALHRSSSWVPMLRGVVGHLAARTSPPRQLVPGQPLIVPTDESNPLQIARRDADDVQPVPLQARSWEGRYAVTTPPLDATGAFVIASAQQIRSASPAAVVSPEPEESAMRAVDDVRIRVALGADVERYATPAQVAELGQRRALAWWPWCLGLALMLMLVELAYAARMVRREQSIGES